MALSFSVYIRKKIEKITSYFIRWKNVRINQEKNNKKGGGLSAIAKPK